jgi:hypothetical protein
MAKEQKGVDVEIRVDWSKAQDEPVQPVNVFAAQASPHYHLLSLGFLAPPIFAVEQPATQRSGEMSMSARIVARILLTPEDMRQLVRVLSDNIETREKLLKVKGER